MYDLTYDEAVKQATERARAEGFGVVVMRHFDNRCYVASDHPGTDIVMSFPVDANGLRIDWPKAHRIRATA